LSPPPASHDDELADRERRPRVLVAEDQLLIALDFEEILNGLGCAVLGPMRAVSDAVAIARYADLTGAVLNVSLVDGLVFPAARLLQVRKIPFFFVTGHEDVLVPSELKGVPLVRKPVDEETFITAYSEIIGV
jgi:CheY-like chemotaxis protein